MSVSVFLVDDQRLVRAGFQMMIESDPGLRVVGEAGDGASAVEALRSVDADVVLMDVRMPVMDGVRATAALAEIGHPAKVLILTTFDLDEYVFAALKAGAAGFLLKDARQEELLSAIHAVADGGSVVAPTATRRLLAHVLESLPGRTADPRVKELTGREVDVLRQIATGASNKEIADHLSMADGTLKTHIGNLLSKLDCRDRVGLVLFAFETGLAKLPS
ncbi:response regulator [Kibdelosporangium phytohabitans]|uniref:LuxR family transcriptional regulator n=1 Tax=Kibdelosporangium phytohabitans TaxID=860235 RepID=A0A0N9IGF9_9PSEU|nr:response regulator transcription factor [Kibdelosporangium phytohabitans]ALG15592.1 LuxR family transcriptional regulator [Kibdelosporangium phytohabitans]MBE1465229.1 DNA-binding NarL/FixJ family response regulator [Kibdelosporangium phytohabitans]